MSNACTLICPEKAYGAVLDALRVPASYKVKVSGNRNGWTTAAVVFPQSKMTFTSMVQKRPGDRFSRLVLSMHNFFNPMGCPNQEMKRSVLEAIENTQMFIGVVADPEFSESEGHFAYLLSVARKLSALIFTGMAMQDADGNTLLAAE